MSNQIIELPCQEGDIAYVVCYEEDNEPWIIDRFIVLGGCTTHLFITPPYSSDICTLRMSDVGKFVFFDREEANEKLNYLNSLEDWGRNYE